MLINTQNTRWRQAFLLALGIAAAIFIPFIIFDGGYFIYYGDFNVQQIPFYKLAHEAVRSGDVFWNWYTDLGANFIGSYSFYLLFSPFFWITLPFPTAWVPFFMAPLLILKTACASLTAYLYLERFVRDNRYAVIGGLFYAFSGWMAFNIFFNHFHDVAVFFPLLPLALEKLVIDRSKWFFAAAVAVNALVNYWFFIGEVIFMMIYFAVRLTDKSFRFRLSAAPVFRIGAEAVLGTVCAAVALVPSVMSLMGNPRTGVSELLTGWNIWFYWHEQRPAAILQSLFFPPELAARPNFFPDHGAKWSSISAWLPMLGFSGVLAYFFQRKNDWAKKLLLLCLVMAMVPGLNSLFILLNQSYYARWFYMPILIMSMASVRALEDCAFDLPSFKRSLRWCALIIAAFSLACGLTPNFDKEGALKFGMSADPLMLWCYTGFALGGLLLTALIVLKYRHHAGFTRFLTAGAAVIAISFTIFMIASGKTNFERSQFVINTAIKGREVIDLPAEPFARADGFETMDNLLMFWHLPNIQAFHSVVPTSIMEFYPKVGVTRDVGSRPTAEPYALRSLLSVRWLFIHPDNENQEPMPGFKKYSEQAGYNIYENENFIPMGFTYDSYMTYDEFMEYPTNQRDNLLLKAVVLEEGAIAENEDILSHFGVKMISISSSAYALDCAARADYAVYGFERDTKGFSAEADFDEPKLVFFSVPWERGWSAEINGEPATIEKANIGFMAVRVPAGHAEIRFNYKTPGLAEGLFASGVGFAVLLACAVINLRRKREKEPVAQESDWIDMAIRSGRVVTLSAEKYKEFYGGNARAGNLQRALNEAEARNAGSGLPPHEQTLRFVDPDENS